jgi:hypothetical protein
MRTKQLQCGKCLKKGSLPIKVDRGVIERSCLKLRELKQRQKERLREDYTKKMQELEKEWDEKKLEIYNSEKFLDSYLSNSKKYEASELLKLQY